jgi:hypothetical protein
MRRATSFRLLLLPAVLFASACDDRPDFTEPEAPPPPVEDGFSALDPLDGRLERASVLGGRSYWADGYVAALYPTTASYTGGAGTSFNRSGGVITITKPASTTGRYVVTFTGLSALLGPKSTVHVTGHTFEDAYCKPAGASLVNDKIEVRCFKASTGAAANASFSLLVTRSYFDLAFAYAHLPTSSNYAPGASGSWNPVGTTTVVRTEPGKYQVTFNKLGSELSANVEGHVQVNAVGTGKVHCKVETWGGKPNLTVTVGCYTGLTGASADSKFTVLFLVPTDHLAYAWGDAATYPEYSPAQAYSTNPSGGIMTIKRFGVGRYTIYFSGADPQIYDYGNMQVTAFGEGATICQAEQNFSGESVKIRCFASNGVSMDSQFTVLLGS